IVGGVGVSGASSAQQDEEIALAGANALLGVPNSNHAVTSPGSVLFFDKDQVARSFANGAVLLDGTNRNYMVNTSRRDAPGQAEIHTLDTDIIYVLEGNATVVTGGQAVAANETGPNELRGERIDGGNQRELAAGQVLVIPAGIPHWFSRVSGPFLYYTIKVR
ncbi:MAG: cupin domain-containing protein, partial [Pyrinomonadaceae bacterium]